MVHLTKLSDHLVQVHILNVPIVGQWKPDYSLLPEEYPQWLQKHPWAIPHVKLGCKWLYGLVCIALQYFAPLLAVENMEECKHIPFRKKKLTIPMWLEPRFVLVVNTSSTCYYNTSNIELERMSPRIKAVIIKPDHVYHHFPYNYHMWLQRSFRLFVLRLTKHSAIQHLTVITPGVVTIELDPNEKNMTLRSPYHSGEGGVTMLKPPFAVRFLTHSQ